MRSISLKDGVFLVMLLAHVFPTSILGTLSEPMPVAWSHDAFRREVGLIPASSHEPGVMSVKYLESQINRALTEEEKNVFARDDGGVWRRYADDILALDLPDDPLLKITVVHPGDGKRMQVVGGRVGSTDNRFDRAYRITVGDDVPYLILAVSSATEFDDGICLCGAIAYEKLQVVDGQARRFSLLRGGDVKKAQVLGGGGRAILIEWTHTSLKQSTYARIAASVRFNKPGTWSSAEWVQRTAGWARIGWLERGDKSDRVEALLGPPTRLADGHMVYVNDERRSDGSGYRAILTVPMTADGFDGFRDDSFEGKELPPLPESLAWAEEVMKDPKDEEGEASETPYSRADKRRVLALFLERADTIATVDWERWCFLLEKLHRQKLRDPLVPALVAARFAEDAPSRFQSAWVLEHYQVTNREALFEERIRTLLRGKGAANVFELGNLYSFLDGASPHYGELMEEGLTHADASVRSDALHHADKLAPEKAAKAARRALENDTDKNCLFWAAVLLRSTGTPRDLPWLKARIPLEKNIEVRAILEEAVAKITASRTSVLRHRR